MSTFLTWLGIYVALSFFAAIPLTALFVKTFDTEQDEKEEAQTITRKEIIKHHLAFMLVWPVFLYWMAEHFVLTKLIGKK